MDKVFLCIILMVRSIDLLIVVGGSVFVRVEFWNFCMYGCSNDE